jgi:quercetin dioxygenase-like cupin family protein
VKSASFATADLDDAWIDGDDTARWRSAAGETGDDSGTSLLEVPAGCRLPLHTDSAEETIVVVDGIASISVGDEESEVPAGGVALVPECVPHEVRNAGDGPLRFVALYAGTDVVTTYEQAIQPGGERERAPLG